MNSGKTTRCDSDKQDEAAAGKNAPDCLSLILTSRCNLACAYCYQNARRPACLDWGALKAGLDFLLSEKASTADVVFTGGEPLLEFDLLRRAVEYVESMSPRPEGLRYWLNTNGLLLSDPIADFLQDHSFKVQLSFDGPEPAQNQRGANTFEILHRLLESMRSRHSELFRHGLRISMLLTPATVPCLVDSVEYFLREGVREIVIAPTLTADPEWSAGDMELLDVQMAGIVDLSLKHRDETGAVPLLFLRHDGSDPERRTAGRSLCRALRGRVLALDADGRVYRCPMLVRSCQEFAAGSVMASLEEFCLGDIRDPDFEKRRAASLHAIRRMPAPEWENCQTSQGRCGDCRRYDECFICPVAVWSRPNDPIPNRVPDFICAFKRTTLKYRDRFRCARVSGGAYFPWLE